MISYVFSLIEIYEFELRMATGLTSTLDQLDLSRSLPSSTSTPKE